MVDLNLFAFRALLSGELILRMWASLMLIIAGETSLIYEGSSNCQLAVDYTFRYCSLHIPVLLTHEGGKRVYEATYHHVMTAQMATTYVGRTLH